MFFLLSRRNTVVLDFVNWLRQHNEKISDQKKKTGFYGIDLYSLQSSRDEVINYLEKVDPQLAEEAKKKYGCFERFSDEQDYGYCTAMKFSLSCEKEALDVLKKMLERHAKSISDDEEDEESFYALENAKIVREAEKYYRKMFEGGEVTWNIRDTHMCDCLQDLLKHQGDRTKVVIWVKKRKQTFDLSNDISFLGA